MTYTVKSGDTLSRIASSYGTSATAIYNLNKTVIGPNMDRIEIGMVLQLPLSGSNTPVSTSASTPLYMKAMTPTGTATGANFMDKAKALLQKKGVLVGIAAVGFGLIYFLTKKKGK